MIDITPDDRDDRDAARLLASWRHATDNAHRLFLRALGYPYEARTPVEFAQSALVNLNDLELQEVLDWMSENHWLPPGC